MRARAVLLFVALVCGALFSTTRSTSAHPLDQLTQHLFVDLRPAEIRVSVAVGGGVLANELVLSQLDPNSDGTISTAEQTAWLERWTKTLRVSIDETTVPISASDIQLSVPAVDDFHFGSSPLLLTFAIPLPSSGGETQHLLAVRNDYLINRTTYRLDVEPAVGTNVIDESWPDSSIRIAFTADPAFASAGNSAAIDAAEAWSRGGVLGKARSALEHERTPIFMITLLGVFLLLGALHAMQPGHGKTLVAAYLVATGGTPRDAFALAGIVTFTHTISVFMLGLATLAASELFLPSKVIPVMGAISGLLVALMGLNMLRGAIGKFRRSADERPENDDPGLEHHAEDSHHHHDHEHLSDEEHARLHLEEALHIRRGVSRRSLITLGVSGGMAPCPDALAILLLAIGMNQAGLGMIAIVSFSAGLATVLVAFGLIVSLAGPAWNRARGAGARRSERASRFFGRLTVAAPMASACIVLVLGLVMAWRSLNLG